MSNQIVYIGFILLIFLVKDLKQRGVSKTMMDNTVYLAILFICVFRYDTTRDYFNYVQHFTLIRVEGVQYMELGFWYLNWLFSSFKYGYFAVFGICSLFTLYSLRKTFREFKLDEWAWFFSVVFLVIMMMNNQIRQAVAMSFFIYSLPYLKARKFFKFSILIIVGCTFHFSVFVCFIYYFIFQSLRHQTFKKDIWLILFFLTYAFYLSGILYDFVVRLYDIFPRYHHYSQDYLYNQKEIRTSGLGILIRSAIGICIILVRDKLSKKHIVYVDMAILYFILALFFNDVRVIMRIVRYLYVFVIIALSLIMMSKNIGIGIKSIVFFLSFVLWLRVSYLMDRPYLTFFSEEKKRGEFYDREKGSYKDERDLDKVFYYKYGE